MSAEILCVHMDHKAPCFLTRGKKIGVKKEREKWRQEELTAKERKSEEGRANG